MEENLVVKKKRGRKPKNQTTETVELKPATDKKKRGRKPKPKPETTEVKVPKKRGRKPLDTNKNIEIVKNTVITEENIILHLPIKTSDIDNVNSEALLMKYDPVLTEPKPFLEDNLFQSTNLNFLGEKTEKVDNKPKEEHNEVNNLFNSEINQPNVQIPKKLEDDNIVPIEQNNKINVDVVQNYDKICNSYNNFSMNNFEKNKVLPIMLEYNEYNKKKEWPSNINMCCFWCSESFDTVPIGIPMKKVDDTYYMFGNFCSPECAAAYLFDNKMFINDCWEKYSLLNLIYGNNESIKLAPSKLCLKKYGGRLNIDEYRNICTKFNKSYKLLLPPMISILPMIEEINLNDDSNNLDMYLLNKDQINKANEEYRLKRNKPLPDSKNTLESCMQLKVL
jgi:hypothetical protein